MNEAVWSCSAVRWEWTHLGVGSGSECGRETLLDHGVDVVIILALGSPVPVLVAMPGRKAAIEVRREERYEDDG